MLVFLQVLKNDLCGYLVGVSSHTMSDSPRKRRRLWIPIEALRAWKGSPTVHVVLLLLHKILHRTKRFINILTAAIMRIIAIATMAAVSRVALHQTVQTTQFVQKWHENASKTWK